MSEHTKCPQKKKELIVMLTKKDSKRITRLLLIIGNVLLLIVSFSLPFFAGKYSGYAKKEELANYVAERVKDSSNDGKTMGFTVTAINDGGQVPRDEDEFLKLYGLFGTYKATFGCGFNFHKDNTIHIDEINSQTNYSVVYTGPDMSMEYYDHYKHWYYPFELMFETERMYDISPYMIYLSQSQADLYLTNKGVYPNEDSGFSKSDYETIIKNVFTISVNGIDYKCVICNIFYEKNYYYQTFKELLGDYLLCAYGFPGGLSKSNAYFFRDKPYENMYFIDYINSTYAEKKYEVKLIENNLTQSFDYDYVNSFYYEDFDNKKTQLYLFIVLSIVLVTLSSILFLILAGNRICYLLSSIFSSLMCYLLFFVYSSVKHSVLFFSNFSITFFCYLLSYYMVCVLLVYLLSKIMNNQEKRKYGKECN